MSDTERVKFDCQCKPKSIINECISGKYCYDFICHDVPKIELKSDVENLYNFGNIKRIIFFFQNNLEVHKTLYIMTPSILLYRNVCSGKYC